MYITLFMGARNRYKTIILAPRVNFCWYLPNILSVEPTSKQYYVFRYTKTWIKLTACT